SGADPAQREALLAAGATVIDCMSDRDGGLDLAAALAALGGRGLTRVLVEGGAGLAAALLRADLVDRLAWFHAPLLIGGDGLPAIAALALPALADAPRFEPIASETIGKDLLTTFRARR
ncbi:MAG: dihydrofolate reductase family protein, partial [Stellaceae bacterium]